MKVTNIKIVNIMGLRRVDVALSSPIALFAGGNGQGKSSIMETIHMAMRKQILRVEKKSEYGLMVREGAKEGSATIVTDYGHANTVNLPAGEIISAEYGYPAPMMDCVLDPHRFIAMTPDERRAFLFELTNCGLEKKKIITRLVEDKNCKKELVERIIPLLRADFTVVQQEAENKAKESRAMWKAVAGSNYGSLKAKDWAAEKPEVDEAALATAEELVAQLAQEVNELRSKVGNIEGQLKSQSDIKERLEQAKDLASKLQRYQDKLKADEQSLKLAEDNLQKATAKAGTAPREGLVHEMARFLNSAEIGPDHVLAANLLLTRYEKEHGSIDEPGDPMALASLPNLTKSRDMAKSALEKTNGLVVAAKAAEKMLAEFGDASCDYKPEDLAESRALLSSKEGELKSATSGLEKMRADKAAAASADERTQKAAGHHADVIEWEKIASALAPDGLPAELLADALKPVNALLQAYAVMTGWRQPRIDPDMCIRADGRPYALHSESEKWRIDAMISAAIASMSDIRIIMLDRVDVLEPAQRPMLIAWLNELCDQGELETALLYGTFKKRPTGLPETASVYWIENGEIREPELPIAA